MPGRDRTSSKVPDSARPSSSSPPASEEARRRAEFDRWVLGIVPQVMTDIQQSVERRSVDFRSRTGADLVVKRPDSSKVQNPKAPWLSYFTLGLGHTLLHIYATRGGGRRLSVHMIPDDATLVPKNQRVLSQAGCLVVRSDEGYELRYLRGDEQGNPRQVIPVDTLIDRAFELLVNVHIRGGP